MNGGELLNEYKKLTLAQKEYAIEYFLGLIGYMDTDPDTEHSRPIALLQFAKSIEDTRRALIKPEYEARIVLEPKKYLAKKDAPVIGQASATVLLNNIQYDCPQCGSCMAKIIAGKVLAMSCVRKNCERNGITYVIPTIELKSLPAHE